MEFETPEWLTKEFIEKALENGRDLKVAVENMKIDMPIAKGNNYMCDIFGVAIKYKISNDVSNLRSKSLIVKAPKKSPFYQIMLQTGFLLKEPKIYETFLPKLRSIVFENSSNNVNDDEDEQIFVESYLSSKDDVLVLEDIKLKDYKMADRVKRFDYDNCVLALKTMAKFHAGSVIIQEKEPELIEEVGKELIFNENTDEMMKGFILSLFTSFIEFTKNHPELKKYTNWFQENQGNFFQMLCDSVKHKENEFNVLNHGDFWVSNIMFKYDENDKPFKVKLIDFQVSRYTSPVIDFIYLMDASVQEDVRKEKFDDLVNIYLKELNFILEQNGCTKKLEKSEFDTAFKDRWFFRVHVILSMLAGCIAPPDTTEFFDVDKLTQEDLNKPDAWSIVSYYKNENYIKILLSRLDELEKLGYITSN